jgi:non-canonical purine NTP pyrophosphatase (RdgB/HAM1 family)
MQSLIFATSNDFKLKEARMILDFDIQGTSIDIPEIQSMDSKEVVTQKAKDYFEQVRSPLFVEDTSLSFDALNGLPGVYINDFSKALGNQGLIDLLAGNPNKGAEAKVSIAYIDENDLYIFDGIMKGHISPTVLGDNGFGWDPIFIPEGENRTFAQMNAEEKNTYSMRRIALEKFKTWLDKELH